MKVLIFSVAAGGGHTHAAEAIKKHIELNNPHSIVESIDAIKYINPILDKVVIGSYLQSLKLTPSLFGKIYEYAETDDSLANVSNKIIEIIVHRLIPLINNTEPDLIISTHPFSSEMISVLKCKGRINIPLVSVLTDYASHSFWIHPGVDAYVVSNCDMIPEMIKRGVEKDKIFDFGIPVSPDFLRLYQRDEVLTALDLDASKATLLLMGGSLGMGRIIDVFEQIQMINENFQLIVITGSNQKLYSKLTDILPESRKSTRIIGFTNEVNKFMQASDLLITKPGGLTITEALIAGLPLALFSAIPGQEEKNAEFLLRHKLAVSLGDGKDCSTILENLLKNRAQLQEMHNNSKRFAKPNCGREIYKLLCSMI
jgi:processive 1,2-diacylglycerol beta-glucosyltransferase